MNNATDKIVINGEVYYTIPCVAEAYGFRESSLRTLIRYFAMRGQPLGLQMGHAHLLAMKDIELLLERKGKKGHKISEALTEPKPELPKRKPGRPRTRQPVEGQGTPRKRGRPRKYPASTNELPIVDE